MRTIDYERRLCECGGNTNTNLKYKGDPDEYNNSHDYDSSKKVLALTVVNIWLTNLIRNGSAHKYARRLHGGLKDGGGEFEGAARKYGLDRNGHEEGRQEKEPR
eukprot:7918842-Heterocapsa_arctica.AAC.1